jgi:PBSX family phage terminase large subunit
LNSTETEVRTVFRGSLAEFFVDETKYVDLEGAFRCGKTTACCFKVLKSCLDNPGINWLVCRWTDSDTHGILKPVWRRCLDLWGVVVEWDGSEGCDIFPNGARVYLRGLKPQSETSRYGKLRGMTLAGVYNDQTEELPYDFYLELKGRLSQKGQPHQMILSPNPEFSEDHYLAKEFPEANTNINHRYYSVPIYENAHNLQANVIPDLEAAYPPGTAKHRPAILGKRGVKVLGKPVYAGYFKRKLHERKVELNPFMPLLESLDFGKHHPCVTWSQFDTYGGYHILGAVMGLDLFIEDFAPIVLTYRTMWFPDHKRVDSCCDPAGSHNNSQGVRKNGVAVLRDHGIFPTYLPGSNSLQNRTGALERLAGYMRRRNQLGEEAFSIDPERQVLVTMTGANASKFVTDGFEAGYVWDPHTKSVGSKPMRAPLKDGWYEHAQNCVEYTELNFGQSHPSQEQAERQAERNAARAVREAQRDHDPYDRQTRQRRPMRGGY